MKVKCTEREKYVLVVSIDNFDRCPYRQIVKVLEAAHLLLEQEEMVIFYEILATLEDVCFVLPSFQTFHSKILTIVPVEHVVNLYVSVFSTPFSHSPMWYRVASQCRFADNAIYYSRVAKSLLAFVPSTEMHIASTRDHDRPVVRYLGMSKHLSSVEITT